MQNLSEKTQGPYEVIPIFNENGKYGICAAYNEGATKSLGKYLVFLHEDIVIHTAGWDENLIKNLSVNEVGLLGQAGAVYKSTQVSAWIDVPSAFYRSNAVAGWNEEKPIHEKRSGEGGLSEVAVLDGMFLAMRKEVWQEFPFDERTFTGFHCYDLDISLSVGSKYKVCVCHDILVEHLSAGSFGLNWYQEAVKLHKKWAYSLPKSVVPLNANERKDVEYHVLLKCIRRHLQLGTASAVTFSALLAQAFHRKPFAPMNLKIAWQVLKNYSHAKRK